MESKEYRQRENDQTLQHDQASQGEQSIFKKMRLAANANKEFVSLISALLLFVIAFFIVAAATIVQLGDSFISLVFMSLACSLLASAIVAMISWGLSIDSNSKLKNMVNDLEKRVKNQLHLTSSGLKNIEAPSASATDYQQLFEPAKSIDMSFNTGQSVVSTTKKALIEAYRNGCIIRILVNDADDHFFAIKRGHLKAYCSHKSVREDYFNNLKLLRDIKREGNEYGNAKGSITVRKADGLLMGNTVIVNNCDCFYVPYLPYHDISSSIRLHFGKTEGSYFDRFKDAFDLVWEKRSRPLDFEEIANHEYDFYRYEAIVESIDRTSYVVRLPQFEGIEGRGAKRDDAIADAYTALCRTLSECLSEEYEGTIPDNKHVAECISFGIISPEKRPSKQVYLSLFKAVDLINEKLAKVDKDSKISYDEIKSAAITGTLAGDKFGNAWLFERSKLNEYAETILKEKTKKEPRLGGEKQAVPLVISSEQQDTSSAAQREASTVTPVAVQGEASTVAPAPTSGQTPTVTSVAPENLKPIVVPPTEN